MEAGLPTGDFSCPITFEVVRPPKPIVKEEGGVTYVVQGDYEIAFRTVLRFARGKELSVRANLFGENSQKVVVRDRDGRPAALSGYTQGRSEILDPDGNVIFEVRYYDTRTYPDTDRHPHLRSLDQRVWQRSLCRPCVLARRPLDARARACLSR